VGSLPLFLYDDGWSLWLRLVLEPCGWRGELLDVFGVHSRDDPGGRLQGL